MATNRKINTTELDFDSIKENFKEYLRGQDQFSDYDFEGSGLSVLLDVLAYNTHYNALYQNLAINEAFLDSASKRASVVSKAKELGYTPQSAKSSTAVVNVTFINNQLDAPAFVEIPRFTVFSTQLNSKTYKFYTVDSYLAYRQDNQYIFRNIILKEGTVLQQRRIIDRENSVVLPNPNVDLATLRVTVQETAQSSQFEVFVRSDKLIELDFDSKVYFVKEIDNGLYELEFGNGVLGKSLEPGNIVTVTYIVGSQDEPNGARTFTYGGSLASNTQSFVTTIDVAFGGTGPESVDDIKWNAPRAYASQNRCVTLDDYKTIVLSQYPNAQSINVWGGEQNNPPSYGDVFISIKPESSEALSEIEKDLILNDIIGSRRVVTLHPKLVDPEYLYVVHETSFYYDSNLTNKLPSELKSIVAQTIEKYNDDNLNRFDGILKFSTLSGLVDASDPSIKSNITTLKVHREIIPNYNQLTQYVIDIGNPIYNAGGAEESIISMGINVLNVPRVAYIDDVSSLDKDRGTLRLFYYEGNNKIVIKNIGYVIYSKGLIVIDDLIITGISDVVFKLIIKPQSNDVVSARNQIVAIKPELSTITPIVESDVNNYTFRSSRS